MFIIQMEIYADYLFWKSSNGHINYDIYFEDMAVDSNGDVYVAGTGYGYPGLGRKIFMVKYNFWGERIWQTELSGDRVTSMTLDNYDNPVLVGYRDNDWIIVKLNKLNGNIVFYRIYDFMNNIDKLIILK